MFRFEHERGSTFPDVLEDSVTAYGASDEFILAHGGLPGSYLPLR
jgi:hypothetical protein